MQQRISEWIKKFNLKVIACEDRPDHPAGDVVYRLKDLFTTCRGSWEPSGQPGERPQWARDAYLRPAGAPDYFDDAGGDHHLFARVLDLEGKPVTSENLIIGWSDGFALLGQPDFAQHINLRMTPKAKSGWANQPIWTSFCPERNESGPWCWCPTGAADVVVGGGLPNNVHISTFAVWQAERRHGGDDQENGGDVDLDAVRRTLWANLNVVYKPNSVFAAYARAHNLGAPLTNEGDIGAYRVQGFAQGIVYAPVTDWSKVAHTGW